MWRALLSNIYDMRHKWLAPCKRKKSETQIVYCASTATAMMACDVLHNQMETHRCCVRSLPSCAWNLFSSSKNMQKLTEFIDVCLLIIIIIFFFGFHFIYISIECFPMIFVHRTMYEVRECCLVRQWSIVNRTWNSMAYTFAICDRNMDGHIYCVRSRMHLFLFIARKRRILSSQSSQPPVAIVFERICLWFYAKQTIVLACDGVWSTAWLAGMSRCRSCCAEWVSIGLRVQRIDTFIDVGDSSSANHTNRCIDSIDNFDPSYTCDADDASATRLIDMQTKQSISI